MSVSNYLKNFKCKIQLISIFYLSLLIFKLLRLLRATGCWGGIGGEKGKNTKYVDIIIISINLKSRIKIVEVVPSTKHLGGCTLRSRTLMLVETKGIYNNPISIVEVVPSTKTTRR